MNGPTTVGFETLTNMDVPMRMWKEAANGYRPSYSAFEKDELPGWSSS